MNYRLVVLTHGEPNGTLLDVVQAFSENVTPDPVEAVLVCDGPAASFAWDDIRRHPYGWKWTGSAKQEGFCRATWRAWGVGVEPSKGVEYVFHLEHDFVVTRPVNLEGLARVLDSEPKLAQMALMRDAVNEKERDAGGLFESRPGEYLPRCLDIDRPWLEQRSYFTTNPSLMRREFMAENPWPRYPASCEGRFGIDLLARGYTFGVWGRGEPWARHIGDRTGFGY